MSISEITIEMTPFGNIDVDDELRAWQESNAEDMWKQFQKSPVHRCPSDMPPCPTCEELNDEDI